MGIEMEGKTIEIKEVPNKNGSGTYTAYVKFDFDKMQPHKPFPERCSHSGA